MGTNSSTSSKNIQKSFTTELTSPQNEYEEYEQYVQNNQCCFVQYQSVLKKKLVWERKMLTALQELTDQEMKIWTNPMFKCIKANHLPRANFLKDINQLKYQPFSDKKKENQILLSPCEVENFKKNLKQSVLISFASAKCSSRINPKSLVKKQLNNRRFAQKSKLKKFKRKKTNTLYLDHFRKSQSSNASNSSVSRSILRQSLISFVDDTLSTLLRSAQKDISKQSAYCLQIFIKFSMILEDHFTNKKCILYHIKKVFVSSIYDSYMPLLNQYIIGNVKTALDPMILQSITDSAKIFIQIMAETIFDYYHLDTFNTLHPPNTLITNQQNLITVITAILFKDQNFYQVIFSAIKLFYNDKNAYLNQVIGQLEGSTPEKFEISPQYCLNTTTLRHHQPRSSTKNLEIQNLNLTELTDQQQKKIPYSACIEIIKNLDNSKTPIAKMKIIMQCSQKITDCVKNFYRDHGLDIEKWVLDADQILSIFQYILVRSKIDNLHTHLYILENFSTDNQIVSITGYYYSVLMCAMEQLQNDHKQNSVELKNQ